MKNDKLSYRIAICALARDCAAALASNISRIEQLRSYFSYSEVFVVENDSKDQTKELLQEWQNQSQGITLDMCDYPQATPVSNPNRYPGVGLLRIEKMAKYRNIYMDWLEQHQSKFDIVILFDIDIKNFDPKTVVESLRDAPKNWGGIFANGYTSTKLFGYELHSMYHDMFAYSIEATSEEPKFSFGKFFKQKKAISRSLSRDRFLNVTSAFGGMGIYKMDAINGLRYYTKRNNDAHIEAVCEHVLFNYSILNKGYACYIDSKLKLYYGASDLIIVVRNVVPLWLFKALCIVFKFKKLKE